MIAQGMNGVKFTSKFKIIAQQISDPKCAARAGTALRETISSWGRYRYLLSEPMLVTRPGRWSLVINHPDLAQSQLKY